jgi:hypothetical protein
MACVIVYCADCDWTGTGTYKPSRCPKCGSEETRRDWDEANDHHDDVLFSASDYSKNIEQ